MTQLIDEAITEAKSEARRRIEQELLELMRQHAPKILGRWKKQLDKPVRGPKDAIRRTITEVLVEDRNQAGRLMLNQLATHHLNKFLHSVMVDSTKDRVVRVRDLIYELQDTAKLAIENYPTGCRPKLPRRIDLGRMIHRYFCAPR